MAETKYEQLGFMKFSGDDVASGVIDAGAAGLALVGLDEALRFFNAKQSADLSNVEYQIPVRTVEGSWIAWVLGVGGTAATVFALSYLKKAGEKMAENDFKEIGLSDVIKKSVDALQYLIKLTKHTKIIRGWDTKSVTWRNDNTEIGILNSGGEALFVPVEYFRWFQSLPPHLISKITNSVDSQRALTIGVKRGEVFEEALVTVNDKPYFIDDNIEEVEDMIFPELKHGDEVKLEGKLTRGNASSNSIGLEYGGHILNCIPEDGSIKRFKSALFLRCVVEGTITRMGCIRFSRHGLKRIAPPRTVPDSRSPVLNVGA